MQLKNISIQREDSQKEIKQIIQKLGYDSNTINIVGSGTYGVAYSIGHNKVLKITSSSEEATISNKLVSRDNNWIVDYYMVAKIESDFNFKNKFAIIMEKVEMGKFTTDFINGNSAISLFLINQDIVQEKLESSELYLIFENLFQKRGEEYLEKIKTIFIKQSKSPYKVMGIHVFNFYNGLLKELSSLNISHVDLKPNNVGFDLRENKFKVFDFMGTGGVEPFNMIKVQ